MKRMLCVLVALVMTIAISATTLSAKGSQHAGGGKDAVVIPDYGDLVVILRNQDGVPVLTADGCIQPLDTYGNPIPLDEECEVAAGYIPVEVDFGRLNIARSPASVLDSRFDEVILYIKASTFVTMDNSGRLLLKMETQQDDSDEVETYWKTIDAPLECLALYVQLMKYGHLQTPANVLAGDNGDEVTYRPTLDPAVDYVKFSSELAFLFPVVSGSTAVETLSNHDLMFASFLLAASGDKTSKLTIDLVQYINTILGIVTKDNALPGSAEFINFRNYKYVRSSFFCTHVSVLQRGSAPAVWVETAVDLMDWLRFKNGDHVSIGNIVDFVASGNDALATIVFVHNYGLPEDLW